MLACTRGAASEAPVCSPCVAFVQTDYQQPQQRLFEGRQAPGHRLHQQIPFLSDGGRHGARAPALPHPRRRDRLLWVHVAMRLTVRQPTATGVPDRTRDAEADSPLRAPVMQDLERLKWSLGHGHVCKALPVVQSSAMDVDAAVATRGQGPAQKLRNAVEAFHTSLASTQGFMRTSGERYRHGDRISPGVVDATVKQGSSQRFGQKHQMAWTSRGAHLRLQIRLRVLHGDWEATFREWSPRVRAAPAKMAACPPQIKRSRLAMDERRDHTSDRVQRKFATDSESCLDISKGYSR